MKQSKKILIMLIGKTHSGKTTFANELFQKNKDLIVLESDPIAIFMKEKFPVLREYDDKEHSGIFGNISLKFKTFLLFIEFTLGLGKPVILSNSNIWQKGRAMIIDLCKKFDYKVIGVYFDLPEVNLLERVKISQRSKDVLHISNDFEDLIIRQRARIQIPNKNEFDEFFHAYSLSEINEIQDKLLKII